MSKENNFTMPLMCPQCNSQDIQFQLVNHQDLKPKGKSFLWWITIGWLWILVKWVIFYVIMGWFIIPFKFLLPKKYKIQNTVENYKICKHCGYHWK